MELPRRLERSGGSVLVEMTLLLVLWAAVWAAHLEVAKEGRKAWRELERKRKPYDGLANGR